MKNKGKLYNFAHKKLIESIEFKDLRKYLNFEFMFKNPTAPV
jgi:hypothetical protein